MTVEVVPENIFFIPGIKPIHDFNILREFRGIAGLNRGENNAIQKKLKDQLDRSLCEASEADLKRYGEYIARQIAIESGKGAILKFLRKIRDIRDLR